LVLKEAYSPQQTRTLYETQTSKHSRTCFWNTHSVYGPQKDQHPWHTTSQYYISSLKANAEDFQNAIRSHWAIENKLHWMLDVAFSEDASRKRVGNSTQNFSILLKIALNILKKDAKTKVGIKSRRFKAAMSNDYLFKMLNL